MESVLIPVAPYCPRCAAALTWLPPPQRLDGIDGAHQLWQLQCRCGFEAWHPRFVTLRGNDTAHLMADIYLASQVGGVAPPMVVDLTEES